MAKVLFLQDVWIEYYGVMQLSALLKKNGHNTDILFASEENAVEEIRKIKPDYVVHGDDWKMGVLRESRTQVIKELNKWSGKLIEYPYTKNISSTNIKENILNSPSFNVNLKL